VWISWSVFAIANMVIALPVLSDCQRSQRLPKPPFGRIRRLIRR
jgi:hypothetical protein